MKHVLLPFLLALAAAAQGQTSPTPDTARTTPTQMPAAAAPNPLSYYGAVDAYYGYDFGNDGSNFRPNFLYSHNRQNEFSVNQAVVGVRYNNDQVRGAIGLHAGSYVEANYASEDLTMRHLYEAYAGFRPFKKAWLDAGIFTSHIGFESAISKDNWTLTRSIMAENSPYYETGARFTYELDPKLTLTALVLNGWQIIRETNGNKALGTQIQWKLSPKLLLNSSTFYGIEGPTGTAQYRRYFHDFYLTYAATDRLSVAGVFDVGKQETAVYGKYDTWHTGAAFVRYQLADRWTATARAEYYYAERGVVIHGITPNPGSPDFRAGGGSLNLDYAPATNVLLRLEGRYLRGRAPVFERADDPTADSYGNLTSSLALSF
ncbi:porin [Hymenobacter sp. BT770]|uniref:porin n=1 Tax=Hymenobacter sp. BT770 TaxID=2886942 RepID=UPI001D11F662|nr:porin [Hymenobacter sp. BT770]MCC3154517.1 porin [Hymenobacter sp. BT770]MDO3416419.1 porin [Hymenobacter sp. BT770]